uniref:Mitochondrial ribosomal protein L12 n=1 Tax=Malurus cyaneus samueli TaxID=2593467 RepID=A0A8C5UBJ1_9PASS
AGGARCARGRHAARCARGCARGSAAPPGAAGPSVPRSLSPLSPPCPPAGLGARHRPRAALGGAGRGTAGHGGQGVLAQGAAAGAGHRGLTLLEVADLNALLKETLKIPDVGVMPAAAAASVLPAQAAPQEEEHVPLKKEKTHFTVRLTELKATDKVKLIKEVKNFVPGVNLVQAKKLVESLPQEIKANASKEEAEKIKAALEAAGGTVVLE